MNGVFETSKYVFDKDIQVLTPYGFQKVEYIHRTKPLECLTFETYGGRKITVAKHHTFVVDNKNIRASELNVNDYLETPNGLDPIRAITYSGVKILYDLSLSPYSEFGLTTNQAYYGNGVLNHNSGKSATTCAYILWISCFKPNLDIGFSLDIGFTSNRLSQARDLLFKLKQMFVRLPIWLTPGVTDWNKTYISLDNSVRVLTDATTSDAFKGATLSVLVIDECAFIRPSKWKDFADSIFPTQSALAWKKNIIISTPKGRNHFYDIVQSAKTDTDSSLVEVDWRKVPRRNHKGELIPPEEFKESIIKKHGIQFFEQNYGCKFLDSVETIIDQSILEKIGEFKPKIRTIENSDSSGNEIVLKVYKECHEDHQYTIGVDTSKDGGDRFAVVIVDITYEKWEVVAVGNFKCNYLDVPPIILEYSNMYNKAKIIVENNEGSGQSVADQLYKLHANLWFDSGKKYPGSRTTKRTRDLMLLNLRYLGTSGNLVIRDEDLIDELMHFTKNDNGKFEADSGHDDLVMALCLCTRMLEIIEDELQEDYEFFFIGDLVM